MTALASEKQTSVLRRDELAKTHRDAMFELLSAHFDGVHRSHFDRDLEEKSHVILIWKQGRLAGFSTLLLFESEFEGRPMTIVYSGDTIVARDAWGSTSLPRAWIASVRELRAEFPRGRYFWLLITSGFRTYRFLPVFWREFFPRFDAATPEEYRRLMNHLSTVRFRSQYHSDLGIVRFETPQRLKGLLREVPAGRENDPHIAFFLSKNPGHSSGDELVCLTELTDSNLTPAGCRMVASPPP